MISFIRKHFQNMINYLKNNLVLSYTTLVLLVFTCLLAGFAIHGFLKVKPNLCTVSSGSPSFLPLSSSNNYYKIFLYNEGKSGLQLNGIPILFIPGSGGSYKQARWMASSSSQHAPMFDWFAIDLNGEPSAFDRQLLEHQVEAVVLAIHQILAQYKEGAAISGKSPTSVILVAHSMGGFVARAVAVHPNLRLSAVETIVTFASPHQLPPIPLQPSLVSYYDYINKKWREGYGYQRGARPMLSHIVVISISGGVNDYQVPSNLARLDGIVPSSHGVMITTAQMRDVSFSVDHQAIMWCQQVIVQVSDALLNVVNSDSDLTSHDSQRRLIVFNKAFHTGPVEEEYEEKLSASSFLRIYSPQIVGYAVVVTFLALFTQSRALEAKKPVPSVLTAIDDNLTHPFSYLLAYIEKKTSVHHVGKIFASLIFASVIFASLIFLLLLSLLSYHPISSAASFILVSLTCYTVANGFVVILVLSSRLVLDIAAVFFKKCWQAVSPQWFSLGFLNWFSSFFTQGDVNHTRRIRIYASEVMKIVTSNPLLVTSLVACFVHPGLGLSILLMSHVLCCLTELCSSSEQLKMFHHRHGMLILHFLAMLMFLPSFVAWFQRFGERQRFPSLLDSILCIGVILHGMANQKPKSLFKVEWSRVYIVAILVSLWSGLALAPHLVLYAMSATGAFSFVFRGIQWWNKVNGDILPVTEAKRH